MIPKTAPRTMLRRVFLRARWSICLAVVFASACRRQPSPKLDREKLRAEADELARAVTLPSLPPDALETSPCEGELEIFVRREGIDVSNGRMLADTSAQVLAEAQSSPQTPESDYLDDAHVSARKVVALAEGRPLDIDVASDGTLPKLRDVLAHAASMRALDRAKGEWRTFRVVVMADRSIPLSTLWAVGGSAHSSAVSITYAVDRGGQRSCTDWPASGRSRAMRAATLTGGSVRPRNDNVEFVVDPGSHGARACRFPTETGEGTCASLSKLYADLIAQPLSCGAPAVGLSLRLDGEMTLADLLTALPAQADGKLEVRLHVPRANEPPPPLLSQRKTRCFQTLMGQLDALDAEALSALDGEHAAGSSPPVTRSPRWVAAPAVVPPAARTEALDRLLGRNAWRFRACANRIALEGEAMPQKRVEVAVDANARPPSTKIVNDGGGKTLAECFSSALTSAASSLEKSSFTVVWEPNG